MTIDEAIKGLKEEKARGTKSVILAWWTADQFQRKDNDEWEYAADLVERKMDWSATHSDLASVLDLYTED